ncbi:hypothetical protein [Silvimonas amylolytica]|uniref:Uncharacterized protein n=1 Tax=Silvimonas amylolytica TaxID=449663 RepID=A0ABQ2PMY4_9NEIS|nr:hypothetical protein [Silvimonas amylolytica]GGP26974.1 hypothetical protein GCM10010971_27930 [Silvimonas amylolytica]
MDACTQALRLLEQEVHGIRARLDAQLPYALQMPMVPAANVSDKAMAAIEQHMQAARRQLRLRIAHFLRRLRQMPPTPRNVAEAQRRYALLKLYFHAALTHFEIFAEVLTQRSQHGTGVWLSGLDVAAQDGLRQPGVLQNVPPVICYVERGHGGAIRRARTRLPGGGNNPVSVIRMPRERMVGTGIAASLFHEVGHQAAALLELVNAFKRALQQRFGAAQPPPVWQAWDRWISEILADLWAVSRVGIAATCGLMSVVSLPRAFVLRINLDDPHPAPWIRVKLSLAMGNSLYPHPQWARLAQIWELQYPRWQMSASQQHAFAGLDQSINEFVRVLLSLRPAALHGHRLGDTLRLADRHPQALLRRWQEVKARPQQMLADTPTLAFAVLGQARFSGLLPASQELQVIAELLQRWALAGYLPWRAGSKELSVVLNQRKPVAAASAAFA